MNTDDVINQNMWNQNHIITLRQKKKQLNQINNQRFISLHA